VPSKTKRPPARKPSTSSPTRRRRPPAPRPPAPPPPPPSDDHLRDAWGVGLLVLAALSALGLYASAAGIVGEFLDLALRGLFGVFGLLVPPALVGAALLLFRDPRPAHTRIAAGAGLTVLAVAGLWHLASGTPGYGAPTAVLHASAGWVGVTVARPLQLVLATAGAAVVLAVVAVLGLLLATATPPRVVAQRAAAGLRAARASVAEVRARRASPRRASADEAPADEVAPKSSPPAAQPDGGPEPPAAEPERLAEPDVHDPAFGDDERGEALSDTQLLPKGLDVGAATKLRLVAEQWEGYELPSLDLLRAGRAAPGNRKTLEAMTRALERTLAQFGVDATVARVSRGPTVTRFELSLGEGVRVGAVTKLGDDISYALATAEIRIVAPIPGKSAIGIEVPNRDRDLITLGDVLRAPEATGAHHPLVAGIGVDIAGNPVLINLATMPHLLIAGATGSGKSVTMNSIVTSVVMRATPADARMILVDPKRVELNHYEGVPHLLTPVVTDPKRATEALDWTVKEMEQRYERLALLGYRNIDTYNAAVRDGSVRAAPALSGRADDTWEELPYILLVIDELADLMMVAPRDVEGAIVRIAQMARAVGIHLVVATQRPSVDVVTGLIKANIPSRIALAMATQADSRTILDQGGAEKLVGHGDMLFLPANASKPHRIQGCYVDEAEIEHAVEHCKAQRAAEYAPGIVRSGDEARIADVTGEDADDEALTRAAMDLVVRSGLGSTSMLQRKLKVGFARAGRLMDELENMGVVGPSEGPKARQVLMTVEELEERR
jgi:S-DNA-T family DNA segregation ATPase FtsK/SpoIIIE